MSTSERNYVGEITLEYFPEQSEISLYIDEVGATFLTMDQVDSLASILRGWVEKYRQTERDEDTARRRSQGAKDGWKIRRAKQKKIALAREEDI